MITLNVVDTEAVDADLLRNLFALDTITPAPSLSHSVVREEITNDVLVPVISQRIEVELPAQLPEEQVENLVNEMNSFSLLTHRTRIAIPDRDIDASSFNYNSYISDAFSYYNIRNEEYENYSQVVTEKSLPNFCLGALWSRQENTVEQRDYYTMLNTIPSLEQSQILAGATPINNYEFDDEFLSYSNSDLEAETKSDYFKLLLTSGSINRGTYAVANTHVFVDFRYNLNDSGKIGNTPFFNRIRLPNLSPLSTNPTNNPLEEVYPSEIVGMFLESSMTDKLIKSFRNSSSFLREFNINGNTNELKVYDVFEMFESIGYGESLVQPDEMMLRSISQNYAVDDNSPFTFYFYKLLLLGKLRSRVRAQIKGFKELVVENQTHPTEHVGFKVIKRIEGRTTPIQTFYFLNRSGLEDFIDTQIKFDRVYTYEVVGMFAVYGSNYSYENVVKQPNNSLSFLFTNKPSLKIVEVPMSLHTLRVVEPPPIVPEITFYNEITSKNKLKIRMEHQDGNIVDEYNKLPMRPFGDNEAYIDKLKQYFKSDNVLIKSGKTSDGVYEIYRLEDPPESYRDFEGNLLATVQSNTIYSNGEQSRNAMFTDLIKHQKKYYYAFRVLTHRGNPSELSPVYVVEMYEDADETFLTFDLYQTPENKAFQPNSHMRKYIQITPNREHLIPNSQELIDQFSSAQQAITGLVLGEKELEEKLFDYKDKNQYIKLRLESKNSGRKMDLNLFFKRKTTNN